MRITTINKMKQLATDISYAIFIAMDRIDRIDKSNPNILDTKAFRGTNNKTLRELLTDARLTCLIISGDSDKSKDYWTDLPILD